MKKMAEPNCSKLPRWTEFTGETKKWCVYGIALNHVLVPSIRPLLEQNVLKEYNYLKSKHCINGHIDRNGMIPITSNFDDKITSHVEYAKLFLEKDIMNFNAFDETCDASVSLCLFGKIGCFSAALQNAAILVQNGRNIWIHYKPSEWVDDDFQQRFHDMKRLVEEVGLSASDKRKVLEDLNIYERTGYRSLTQKLFPTNSHKINNPFSQPRNYTTLLETICHLTNKVVGHYTHNLITMNTESRNVIEQKVTSELLNSTLEVKVVFAETLRSLDLFENYLKRPSEETAIPLKKLFGPGKCCSAEPLTPDEVNGFLETSRLILITPSLNDKDSDELQDSDQDSCNSGNRNLDLDLNSQPNSISPPLSPNYEIRKTNFENEKPNNVAQSYDQNNPENAFNRGEDDFAQAALESKAKTKRKDFAYSERDPDGQQRNELKDKKPESKAISDTLKNGAIKKERQGMVIHGYTGYSGDKKKMKNEKMTEQNTLKARDSPHFFHPPALMTCSRVKELEDENLSLKKQVKSLQVKIEEILVELGEITVEKTAKENEERKSEHFRQIFHPPLHEDQRSGTFNSRYDRSNNDQKSSGPNGSLSPPILNTSVVSPASSSEHPANGAEALMQENNLQLDYEKKLSSDENESELHGRNHGSASTVMFNGDQQTPTTHNIPDIQSDERSRDREGNNQFQENHIQASTSRNGYDDLSFSVQQHDPGREPISLSNIPPTSVATTLYNNYKILLLSLAQKLLSSDVKMLQDWAAQNFSINNPQNATDILLQLDQKGVINASDLHQLSDFFESIIRFDLVHIIDAFLLGDYNLLRQSQASKRHTGNLVQNHGHTATLPNPGFLNAMSTRQSSMNARRNLGMSRKPTNNIGVQNSLPQAGLQSLRNSSDTADSTHLVSSPRNQSTTLTQSNPNKPATGFNSVRMAEVAVSDGQVANERRATSGRAGTGAGNTLIVSSNGSKHSKFQRPDKERSSSPNRDPDLDSNWLCSHYKRHCYVKFDCCDKFWPCHRCHNNQSTCGRKKLKSRDTRMLKCVHCNKVQQFGQHCCNCGAEFANYYCELCKHLTGTDDRPYHCEKCGICRIHGDRSFHCDVCGVCLDVQLRGNHKCREGSAHDECCICLEDAFTGCQILPCSHKVHKECATQMIRSGITRCPICRESFAHKLERGPQNLRKRPGK